MATAGYKAVILDMDGVLTRTAVLHARAWQRMFNEYLAARAKGTGCAFAAFDIDTDYPRYVDGKPRYQGVRSFLESRGIDLPWGDEGDPPGRETICGLGNRKNELFHELLARDGVVVFDDALEQTRRWRTTLKTALITSSRNGRRILAAANLTELFDVVIDGTDLRRLNLRGKPAPDVFLRAAEELGVAPAEAVVIEDAIAGVRAGRDGGFGLVVGVARDGDGAALRDNGADRVVSRLTEIDLEGGRPKAESGTTLDSASAFRFPLSAFGPGFAERLNGKRIALFLDYDGTLTSIVDRPEDATLSDEMRSAVRRAAERLTAVAVVSGRDLADVRCMVGLDSLVYAGSHGFDIAGPDDLRMQHEEAKECLPALDAAEAALNDQLATVAGCRVERKRFAIAIHYRQAADADVPEIEAAVDDVLRQHPRLRKRDGKKIFELQPDVEWDKGRAVLWLLEKLGLDRPDVLPIYIGDDVTDEDAFAALRERGIGVCVDCGDRETNAPYSLPTVEDVGRFLRFLSEREADDARR